MPIWHGVSKREVAEFSPSLSDKFAIDTQSVDVQEAAIRILRTVRPDLYKQHPRVELERLSSGEAIVELQSEIEELRDQVADYQCPHCAAPLPRQSRTSRQLSPYGTTNHAFAIKGAATAPALVIENLLPNPVGDDRQLETVTVRNDGGATVPLAGWTLRDEAGRSWSLAGLGSVAAGMSLTIQRSGQEMSLNNAGDEISLVDPQNVVRDQFRYTASSEGTIIQTSH